MTDSTKARIGVFEKVWTIQCKEIEKDKLSPKDAEDTKKDFENVVIQLQLSPFDHEENAIVERVRSKLNAALEKAVRNYRSR